MSVRNLCFVWSRFVGNNSLTTEKKNFLANFFNWIVFADIHMHTSVCRQTHKQRDTDTSMYWERYTERRSYTGIGRQTDQMKHTQIHSTHTYNSRLSRTIIHISLWCCEHAVARFYSLSILFIWFERLD